MNLLIFYICVMFLSLVGIYGNESKPYRKVLVFGGNGLLGSATVNRLLDDLWADVTIVNRGNWYWDTESYIKSRVRKHISCDRSIPLTKCAKLMREIQSSNYHGVIDFSAYDPASLQSALTAINGRTSVYVYVSSDSAYEVCAERNHTGAQRETDAVRPHERAERERLAKGDDYGDRKLRCEDLLRAQRATTSNEESVEGSGVPYIILRLPDVIGERDNTLRWWYYQLLINFYSRLGLPHVAIPAQFAHRPMSLVYADDVAALITELINRANSDTAAAGDSSRLVQDEVFNVAFDERPTLHELLRLMQKSLRLQNVSYDMSSEAGVKRLYPTVLRGPVETKKVKLFTDWRPRPLDVVVRSLVEFHERAARQHPTERAKVLWLLASDLLSREQEVALYRLIDDHYRTDQNRDSEATGDTSRDEL